MMVVMVMREWRKGNRRMDGWMHCLLIFPISPPLLTFVSYREDDGGDGDDGGE